MSKKTAKKTTKSTAKKSTGKATKTAKKAVEEVIRENSLVYIDYVARIKGDGKIFDLTLEDVAKQEGLYKENDRYEPMLVAVGWNWLLASLEEEIIGMKVGESRTVEIPPEKGAGVRDQSKVKMIPKTKMAKHGERYPVKGAQVTVGREQGVITAVLGRTVRVDFNSPLAGKTLVFEVTLREIVSTPEEKLLAVIKRRIPGLPKDNYKASVKGKTVTIELPKETRYIENIQYAEIGIAADALKVIEKANEVKLTVTFERPEPPKENTT
ncbi:MAG: FKBP-type peptidyl-prolyl cis-trans isomerase [Candidatus Thorarchaeota archaeon]|jgi:FKBP-type peptidyl-prolyl cis-trans isomerase 2